MAKMNRKLGYGKTSRTFVTAAVQEIAEEKLGEFSDLVYEGMKQKAPVNTGALRAAIRKRKTSDVKHSVYVSSVQLASDSRNPSHIDYSYIVWKGHRAYTIEAKDKPMRWIGKDGEPKYAWRVHIPQTKGKPFVEDAIAYAKSKFKG